MFVDNDKYVHETDKLIPDRVGINGDGIQKMFNRFQVCEKATKRL